MNGILDPVEAAKVDVSSVLNQRNPLDTPLFLKAFLRAPASFNHDYTPKHVRRLRGLLNGKNTANERLKVNRELTLDQISYTDTRALRALTLRHLWMLIATAAAEQ